MSRSFAGRLLPAAVRIFPVSLQSSSGDGAAARTDRLPQDRHQAARADPLVSARIALLSELSAGWAAPAEVKRKRAARRPPFFVDGLLTAYCCGASAALVFGGNAGLVLVPRRSSSAMLSALSFFTSGGM